MRKCERSLGEGLAILRDKAAPTDATRKLQRSVDELTARLSITSSELASMAAELDFRSLQLAESERACSSLTAELHLRSLQLADSERKCKTRSSELSSMSAEMLQLRSQLAGAERARMNAIATCDAQAEQYQAELQAAKQSITKAEIDLFDAHTRHASEIALCKNELAMRQDEIELLNMRHASRTAAVDSSTSELITCKANHAAMSAELTSCKNELAAREHDLDQMVRRLATAVTGDAEMDALLQRLADAENELGTAQLQLQTMTHRLSAAAAERDTALVAAERSRQALGQSEMISQQRLNEVVILRSQLSLDEMQWNAVETIARLETEIVRLDSQPPANHVDTPIADSAMRAKDQRIAELQSALERAEGAAPTKYSTVVRAALSANRMQ